MNMTLRTMSLCAMAALSALPALADELPARMPGLWESSTSVMAGMPVIKVKQCIDAKTDQLTQAAVLPGAQCSKKEVRKIATGYEIETDCKISGMSVVGKGLITGDFATHIRMEMTTMMSGIPGQPGGMTTKIVIETARVGDCQAGQKPGDIIMSDGRVIKTPGT